MLSDCILRIWTPSIGDPHFMGWFTVFAYFATGFLAWRVHVRLRNAPQADESRRAAGYWLLLAILLLALGVNKQLDLQSFFTAVGKCTARSQGWYEHRREIQMIFIVLLLLASAAVLFATLRFFRGWGRAHYLSIFGVTFMLCFIVLRASSFHHVETLLHFEFLGVRMNWVLELSGLALIMLNAILLLRQAARRRHADPAGAHRTPQAGVPNDEIVD